jgi:hypothetical protein
MKGRSVNETMVGYDTTLAIAPHLNCRAPNPPYIMNSLFFILILNRNT